MAMCEGRDGKAELHWAYCKLVRYRADVLKEPVYTMLGCQGLPAETPDIRWHECVREHYPK